MQLITTHLGADFDGFAAMLAARKLHPEAALFFPGSREESLRKALDTGLVEFDELRQKDVDPAGLTRVILCDIRQRDRLGVVGEWLEQNPGIEVWAYDHHPPSEADLAVTGGRVDPEAGSTATLMVELLRERGLEVSPNEATALLLGIYEDTGLLTYPTTGPREHDAAAWLLRQGADLAAVRRFAARRLDPTRIEVLHRMTRAVEVHRLRGHRVGLVELDLGEYVDELAPLVSRCLELFDLPLLFALFGEGDRVTLIARGELPGFDLGAALADFAGGGGHPTAASARLPGTTLEIRERLLAFLGKALPPAARAADLMVQRFATVPAELPVAAAKQELVARRINAAPVVDGEGRVAGIVTRQLLDAALQHGLGERAVERVMSRELEWVTPDAPADEVAQRMAVRHPRLVLVGDPESGRPLGLVTRMQVLRHLHGRLEEFEEAIDRRSERQRERREQVRKLLDAGLAPGLRGRVERIAAVSRRLGVPAYLVGGLVRDLLLGRENRDLDVVVEGDGPDFARALAQELGARVRVHDAFLTAVVTEPDGFQIDVATARSEFYRAPAALPEVQMSPLRQDLYRRDFTINTLALRLGPEEMPELIDYFGGRRDLREGVLRVLHSLSFIDDPTRALRAVRLELRLGFHLSPETQRLLAVALGEGAFDRLSGARLREELLLLLDDDAIALRGLERLEELGLLHVLHPHLALDAPARERLREALAAYDWYRLEGLAELPVRLWRLLLLALAGGLEAAECERLARRLMLAEDDRRALAELPARLAAAQEVLRGPRVPAHRVAEALEGLAGEELLLLMAGPDERGRAWVRRDLTELRRVTLGVRGGDLLAAGVPPGPWIGEALRATRRARLDGRIGPGDELRYALAQVVRDAPAEARAAVAAPRGEPS
jgi:tRNA nucleotidyltransferase (CCA-adding enzyme)